jgi:transposase
MKKISKPHFESMTIGLDLGDRFGHYCILSSDGEIVCEERVRMTRDALTNVFEKHRGSRVAIETGTHALRVSEHLSSLGLDVIVANARELSAITGSDRKKDKQDARKLAMYARVDVRILRPVKLRSSTAQADLALIRARAALVESRTQLVNTARGLVKSFGYRLPDCTAAHFSNKALGELPTILQDQLIPLLAVIDNINAEITSYDKKVENLARERYPEAAFLQQINGVGPLTAVTFVLTLGDPRRFFIQSGRWLLCRTDTEAQSIWRLRSRTRYHESRRHVFAKASGAVFTPCARAMGPRFRTQTMGVEAGTKRRQERKEAGSCCSGTETVDIASQTVDQPSHIRTLLRNKGISCCLVS